MKSDHSDSRTVRGRNIIIVTFSSQRWSAFQIEKYFSIESIIGIDDNDNQHNLTNIAIFTISQACLRYDIKQNMPDTL